MRITVLLGGPSKEREVSLSSGRSVADALRSMGHEVFEADISPDDLSALDHPCDVIFPVLHGTFGESGELQEILEERDIPFVGSSSTASRIGMDKVATKRLWQRAALPTPRWEVINRTAPAATLGGPCVVKPIDGGSSIDVFICQNQLDTDLACDKILAQYDEAMVEGFIDGAELTVGLLEDQPLDPIRIVCKHEFFDYSAKYDMSSGTEHHFDLNLTPQLERQCRELAREAHRAIGCRDLSRVDLMIDRQGSPWLIEINTMPGFTPTSLLPEAAQHAGISFGELVDRLVKCAYARRGKPGVEIYVAPPKAKRLTA